MLLSFGNGSIKDDWMLLKDMLGQHILQADNGLVLLARFHYIIRCLASVVGAS